MGLLLYKSDEMYSATDLIRKSKMIFNKVLNKEIDKAIILRDGKPTFLLMEFQRYEQIMAEYEMLKSQFDNKEHKNIEVIKTPTTSKVEKIKKLKEYQPNITNPAKEKEISEKDEISKALQSIESMDFNDEMKEEAKQKITLRIQKARDERARIMAEEISHQEKEDLKEELILQQQLNEVKKQKDRELKEFWD